MLKKLLNLKGQTNTMKLRVIYHYFADNLEKSWKSKEIEDISFLQAALVSDKDTYSYTQSICRKTSLFYDSHEFNFKFESQPLWISFVHILISFIVTSLTFLSWNLQLITSYRTLRALMSTVCMKWLQIRIWCVTCLQQWTYTEQHAACLMLTHFFPKHFSVMFA